MVTHLSEISTAYTIILQNDLIPANPLTDEALAPRVGSRKQFPPFVIFVAHFKVIKMLNKISCSNLTCFTKQSCVDTCQIRSWFIKYNTQAPIARIFITEKLRNGPSVTPTRGPGEKAAAPFCAFEWCYGWPGADKGQSSKPADNEASHSSSTLLAASRSIYHCKCNRINEIIAINANIRSMGSARRT